MPYLMLADGVVVLHFLWIVFLVFGGFWGRRSRAVGVVHLSGLAFSVLMQVFDWYCPLTHLEVWLRARHDPSEAYAGSYIVHYLEELVYIELSRTLIFVLTLLLCGANLWLYLGKRRRKADG
jgi:hypothetical protein